MTDTLSTTQDEQTAEVAEPSFWSLKADAIIARMDSAADKDSEAFKAYESNVRHLEALKAAGFDLFAPAIEQGFVTLDDVSSLRAKLTKTMDLALDDGDTATASRIAGWIKDHPVAVTTATTTASPALVFPFPLTVHIGGEMVWKRSKGNKDETGWSSLAPYLSHLSKEDKEKAKEAIKAMQPGQALTFGHAEIRRAADNSEQANEEQAAPVKAKK